jgi:hypothetical protein
MKRQVLALLSMVALQLLGGAWAIDDGTLRFFLCLSCRLSFAAHVDPCRLLTQTGESRPVLLIARSTIRPRVSSSLQVLPHTCSMHIDAEVLSLFNR